MGDERPVSEESPMSLDGRLAAIATKHGKEALFGPPLHEHVGLTVVTAQVDTDLLGTFTGEVARVGTARDTARRKAELAIQHTDATIGIGSEGSFGPHPAIPFIPVDVELAVVIDIQLGLEVTESYAATDTNYSEITLDTPTVPQEFLDRVGFPEHALIVLPVTGFEPLHKGLRDVESLSRAIDGCFESTGTARIQTDMRAHLNPSRSRAIGAVAEQLARRLAHRCPRCDAPGWGIVERTAGLPCGECGTPTDLIASNVFACARRSCSHQQHIPTGGKAGPAQCPTCNP